jgi:hypothetical protein
MAWPDVRYEAAQSSYQQSTGRYLSPTYDPESLYLGMLIEAHREDKRLCNYETLSQSHVDGGWSVQGRIPEENLDQAMSRNP